MHLVSIKYCRIQGHVSWWTLTLTEALDWARICIHVCVSEFTEGLETAERGVEGRTDRTVRHADTRLTPPYVPLLSRLCLSF